MLSLEEIRNLQINATVAREAYDQVSKRLADVLDTKKVYEQKAFTLFNGYLTVALALLGVGGALYKSDGLTGLVVPFFVAGALFVLGAIFFVLALIDKEYGALASAPDMWLNKGTIDGPDSVLPLMLAYITRHHHERIERSTQSNETKARRIRRGIYVGIAAPFILLVLFVLPLPSTAPSSQVRQNPAAVGAAVEVEGKEPQAAPGLPERKVVVP